MVRLRETKLQVSAFADMQRTRLLAYNATTLRSYRVCHRDVKHSIHEIRDTRASWGVGLVPLQKLGGRQPPARSAVIAKCSPTPRLAREARSKNSTTHVHSRPSRTAEEGFLAQPDFGRRKSHAGCFHHVQRITTGGPNGWTTPGGKVACRPCR